MMYIVCFIMGSNQHGWFPDFSFYKHHISRAMFFVDILKLCHLRFAGLVVGPNGALLVMNPM